MARTHKEANNLPLAGIALGYALALAFALNGASFISRASTFTGALGAGVLLSLVGYLISILLLGQLDAIQKARLIFLRWSDPLPGGEAFSRWIDADSRIDKLEIRRKHAPFPEDRAAQNRLWYKLYKAVDKEGAVEDASKHYLLCRDATILSIFMGAITVAVLILYQDSASILIGYSLLTALISLSFWQAARMAGRRLVISVLILNPSTEQPVPSSIIT